MKVKDNKESWRGGPHDSNAFNPKENSGELWEEMIKE
jgi:hypothetical protein